MDAFTQRQQQAEDTVEFLKKQLEVLTKLAANRKQSFEEDAIKKLVAENGLIENDIVQLKRDLRFYEAQNGVKHIPIPRRVQTNAPTTISDTAPTTEPAPVSEKQKKKNPGAGNEKKGNDSKKKDKAQAKTGQKSVEESKPIDASRLNMKVGKIVGVKKHPDADSLYVEEVDLGEERNRTIISGLVKHYQLEQMQDRMAIFLCNLKPAKMRGLLSEGMIMCASTPEKVEILEVPANATVGDRVTCEGFTGEPEMQLNPKKKIWEQVQPDLRVDSNGIPGYKGGAFSISGKGYCKAPTMKDCPIK